MASLLSWTISPHAQVLLAHPSRSRFVPRSSPSSQSIALTHLLTSRPTDNPTLFHSHAGPTPLPPTYLPSATQTRQPPRAFPPSSASAGAHHRRARGACPSLSSDGVLPFQGSRLGRYHKVSPSAPVDEQHLVCASGRADLGFLSPSFVSRPTLKAVARKTSRIPLIGMVGGVLSDYIPLVDEYYCASLSLSFSFSPPA